MKTYEQICDEVAKEHECESIEFLVEAEIFWCDTFGTSGVPNIIKEIARRYAMECLKKAAENAEAWCYAEGNDPKYGVDKKSIYNEKNLA